MPNLGAPELIIIAIISAVVVDDRVVKKTLDVK